jgi:hypothetical protein
MPALFLEDGTEVEKRKRMVRLLGQFQLHEALIAFQLLEAKCGIAMACVKNVDAGCPSYRVISVFPKWTVLVFLRSVQYASQPMNPEKRSQSQIPVDQQPTCQRMRLPSRSPLDLARQLFKE